MRKGVRDDSIEEKIGWVDGWMAEWLNGLELLRGPICWTSDAGYWQELIVWREVLIIIQSANNNSRLDRTHNKTLTLTLTLSSHLSIPSSKKHTYTTPLHTLTYLKMGFKAGRSSLCEIEMAEMLI